MKRILLSAILFYQKYLSLDAGWARVFFLTDKACRFIPTCSEYSYQAIEKYGTIKGLWLSLRRILRCHPFSRGGIDEIPS